ncbi:unnamed protein product [Oikopleura dioica]|uniref:C2H2-type domain-containing protein n=1 Tax=Oikopleura dioica TaxID=34765 RepID=E4YDL6_OIKDI|nr:unnamed protein product [Oikopleura dioica]
MRDALTCVVCEAKFKSQWLLDAHQKVGINFESSKRMSSLCFLELAKGHDDALAWCRELQRLKLEEVGLDIDDLEDYSHLYGDSSEDESEPEAEDFNFDFAAVKTDFFAEKTPAKNASDEEREDKYDPMNFSDEEAPAKTEIAEEIPPLSENESDDDGPPPLELAGPPELEEIPPHHQDNILQSQPLDDVINSFTPPTERKRPKRKLRIPARARKYTSDEDFVPEDYNDEEYDPGVENSPPTKTARQSYAQVARNFPNTTLPESQQGMVDLALHPMAENGEPITPSKVDRSEYTSGEPKKCKFCDKEFRSFAQLDQHQRCHTGEKPYLCVHCHKTFRQKAHLTTHVRIHTGARPYQCKVCGKGFIQSQHLKNHMRLHTGEKPFQCKTCKKFFSQISNLRHHERGHKRKGEWLSGSEDDFKKEKEEPPAYYTPSPRQAPRRRAAAVPPRPDSSDDSASEKEPPKEASIEEPNDVPKEAPKEGPNDPSTEVPEEESTDIMPELPSMDSLEMSAFDEDPMDTSVPMIRTA